MNQVVFIAADTSAGLMSAKDGGDAIYRHYVHLTKYFNHHDEALDLSNPKTLGNVPRVGRSGLPPDASPVAVNFDFTKHLQTLTGPTSYPGVIGPVDLPGWRRTPDISAISSLPLIYSK